MSTFTAHVRGKAIVPDEPVDLPDGAEVTVTVVSPMASLPSPVASSDDPAARQSVRAFLDRLPLLYPPPGMAREIAEDPDMEIEEA